MKEVTMINTDIRHIYEKFETLLKAKDSKKPKAQDLFVEYSKKHISPLFEKTGLLDSVYKEFGTIELKYNSKDLVSSTDTFINLKTKRYGLFCYVALLAAHPTRSIFYGKGEAPTYGALVPLVMAAQKEFKGITYESWDKNDPAIKYAVGFTLWGAIKDWLLPLPELDKNMLEVREETFNSSKLKNKTYSSNIRKSVVFHGDKTIKLPVLPSIIKCQFWLANARFRTSYMILDLVNWDNMPEAFDNNDSFAETAITVENKRDDSLYQDWL